MSLVSKLESGVKNTVLGVTFALTLLGFSEYNTLNAQSTKGTIVSVNKLNNNESDTRRYPQKDLSDKFTSDRLNHKKYYTFDDKNFILEKYDGIPARNREKPVYETLTYDTANYYFCYEFKRSGKDLHKAFIMTHELLASNNVSKAEEKHPYINRRRLPAIAPDSMPDGSVYNENLGWLYFLLNKTLSSDDGYFIHKAWKVPSQKKDAKTHIIEAIFNKNEYIIKIYQ